MGRDSTIYPSSHHDTNNAGQPAAPTPRLANMSLVGAARLLALAALAALLLALAYQIPVAHTVDIGGYDAAYVQGFYDPERAGPAQDHPELAGSDGSARWTRDTSYLVFPQAGLPARVVLRLRGWRPSGAPPRVSVLLNGSQLLGQFQASAGWQEYAFTIDGGLLKPNDVVIEIRSDTAQLDTGDPRAVGVLLDRATYSTGPAPILPYPAQLAYAALAAAMLYLLITSHPEVKRQGDQGTRRGPARLMVSLSPGFLAWLVGTLLMAVAFLALYRAQPPYPYPLLRLLPAADAILAALLALRFGPALARRAPALIDAAAAIAIGAWAAAVLVAAQAHVTLSLPSVEKDFRVFALRSAHLLGRFPAGTTDPSLDGVLRADGFYNLGYPLVLWLVRPFTHDNPFLAARLVAAISGALLLAAGWWLARRLLGRGPALLAVVVLALSPLVVEYVLYVGTDMPFAALCALAVALIVAASESGGHQRRAGWLAALAGLVAGLAFLMRHPGLLLLPLGWLALWSRRNRTETPSPKPQTSSLKTGSLLPFTLAFLIAIAPQAAVNIRDTGQPLYSQQAKNVWQAVFGEGDWGRWGETANDISIGQVVAQDPGRFVANWWANVRGYFGTGGEDTREFGQAVQLRLLGFPANWLAVAALLGWLVAEGKRQKAKSKREERSPFTFYLLPFTLLLLWIALYVAFVSVGLAFQARFALPLAPIYALAAAWAVARLGAESQEPAQYASRFTLHASHIAPLIVGLLLLALLWGNFQIGADYVTRARASNEAAVARAENRAEQPGQPADEVAIIGLAQATLRPGERLVVRADPAAPIGKYSAIAHLAVPAPAADTPEALRASGAKYLIWSAALGQAPNVGAALGTAGIYTLYRIER
jgi:4-amino-4-deoxy-L-arabinose transferase-like glycosyltransferase